MLTIYHNPRCSKSRQTLQLISEKGVAVKVIEYLIDTPTEEELKTIISKLGIKPADLVRKSEEIYKEQYKEKNLSDVEWVRAMVAHPKLIERPIVVSDKQAVLGRPPENVMQLL